MIEIDISINAERQNQIDHPNPELCTCRLVIYV
jgi:hypothetical protein